MLNSDSPVPLYRQLADLLTERIRAGEYPVGARIPSEPALSDRFGIGRPTVRQATDLLVRRGLLERRRGAGTFVRDGSDRVDLFSLAGTLRSFRDSGLLVEPRVLEPLRQRRVPLERAGEGHPFAGREVLSFARLSAHEGAPVLLERFDLDPELFAALPALDLGAGSLSALIEERLHLRPTRAEQVFEVVSVTGKTARALSLGDGTCALRVRRHIDFPGVPSAIYVELWCRTDRLAFCQTIPGVEHA